MNISKLIKNLFTFVSLFVCLGFAFAVTVSAKDLEITYNNEYFIEAKDNIRVVSTHIIRNKSTDTVLRKENTEVFVISHLKSNLASLKNTVATVKVTAEGQNLPFDVDYQDEYAFIKVEYPRKIINNDSLTIKIEYQNYGLIERAGALYDIYIPGIPKETEFELENQSLDLNNTVYINDSIFPEENFVMPEATAKSIHTNGYKKYFFDAETILGKTIWIQRGKKQFYQFQLTQKVESTMKSDIGLKNEYALVLPRDVNNLELYQKVYFDKIQPLPDYVEKDSDGNLIGHFSLPSAMSGEIIVTGFVEVGVTGKVLTEAESGSLSDYNYDNFQGALQAAEYWEVEHPDIQNVATNLLAERTNVFQILNETFNFVTNRIDYSDIKRLGINQRQGALETLENGSGVCMEYADLFLALARAQGIPTRAVFGYGFDPRENSDLQQTHQWVTSYIPALDKWYDLDVTWGDSGQVAEGGNLNHFYTHIVSEGPNVLPDVSVNIFGTKNDIPLPQYEISAQSELAVEAAYQSQDELLEGYEKTETTNLAENLLQIPLKVGAYFGSIPNKDLLSIILFTVGFCLIIIPIVIIKRKHIDFGENQKESAV